MPVPSSRTPVRIARGTYANLSTTAALEALALGEVCFATDQDRLYMRTLGGLTAISSTNETAPTPAQVTASPAFTGGTGTQADPYLITNVGSPFSGASLTSAHEITISGTAGDIAVFTDNSPSASADRFKGQDVGILNAAGEFKLNLKYADEPGTTTDNTTYTGNLQIGTAHITWVVVQSNLTQLSEDSVTTITGASGVGDVITATPGTATGGTAPYTSEVKWQRSFTGTGGFFDTGSGGTSYTITSADAGYYVRAVTTVTDSTSAAQGGPLTIDLPSEASAQLNTNQVTTVNSLTLSEDNTAGARFTSQTYSVDAILNPDGVPTSTKSVKVKFEGSFGQYPSTSNITNISSVRALNTNTYPMWQYEQGGNSNTSTQGQYTTPFLVRNPNTDQLKWFSTESYSQYASNPSWYLSGSGIENNTSPFQPNNSSERNTNVQWRTTHNGTTLKQIYQNHDDSTGWWSYRRLQPVRVIDQSHIFTWMARSGWLYTDNPFQSAGTLTWNPPAWNVLDATTSVGSATARDNDRYAYAWTDSGNYMVVAEQAPHPSYPVQWAFRIISPDKSAGENIMTTTNYSILELMPTIEEGNNDYQSSGNTHNIFAKGEKIFIQCRYYRQSPHSNYVTKILSCDFSVNDGTQPSHWSVVFTKYDYSANYYPTGVAIEKDGSRIFLAAQSYTSGAIRSEDNGDTWTYVDYALPDPDSVFTTSTSQPYCNYVGNLLVMGVARYTESSMPSGYSLPTSKYNNTFYSSTTNGNFWNFDGWAYHGHYSNSYPEPQNNSGHALDQSINHEGGWLLINGRQNGNSYYPMMGWSQPSYDEVTFADTTNLTNMSFRAGNKVRQGTTSFRIVQSAQTTKVYDIQGGEIVTGAPVTNTVSYFGGSQATLYAVLSGAGAVTDLTSSDPGFVNLGYAVNNTITFPATLPSGSSPDVELPAGTTIQATVEFTNSQGTVTADSNTLTP